MKKDPKSKAEVRKSHSAVVPISEPRPAQQPAPLGAEPVKVNWSARYIDSRLKQFYCR